MGREIVCRRLDNMIKERGNSYAAISRLIGKNPSYIQQFIKRGTPHKLDEKDRQILAHHFRVEEHLLCNHQRVRATDAAPTRATAIIRVPVLPLGLMSRSLAHETGSEPLGALAFDARWLRSLSTNPLELAIIRIEGEAMSPTLMGGDDILVDPHDAADRLRDGIYVLRVDGLLMVKRVAVGPHRHIVSLLTDNPRYPDWLTIDASALNIVGRVIWIGRSVH